MGIRAALGVTAGAVALILILWAAKSPKGIRYLFLTSLEGLAAFCAVNLIGVITGVTVAVNFYTLPTAMLCGIPGVISLLMFNYILNQ